MIKCNSFHYQAKRAYHQIDTYKSMGRSHLLKQFAFLQSNNKLNWMAKQGIKINKKVH